MNKNLKYQILYENDLIDLEKSVNDSIQEGWEPLGGPVVCGLYVIQAMIKNDIPEKEDTEFLTPPQLENMRTWLKSIY